MKSFFKSVLAAMLGVLLASIVGFFLFIGLIAAIVSSGDHKEVKVKEGSVLHIQLTEAVKERTSKNPFDNFDIVSLSSKKSQPGLNDILQEIKFAKTDANIKGIYLDVPAVSMGMATMEEIRNALLDFKKSGKFIYAYAENYTQGAYYLVSVSDKIYLNPQGSLALTGVSTQLMFYKGTLDKLEIEPQVIRHGKFKSAVEPYIRENMSDENREQIAGFVNPIWNHIVTNVASARKITPEAINLIADSLKINEAKDALDNKLIDKLAYYDEFMNDLSIKAGKSKDEAPEFITLNQYKNAAIATSTAPDKIAVIYANGEISGGEGDDDKIGSETLAKTIADARKDEKVKAIVLRVNSPGGDALASDVIWREVVLAKKVKPVVVSMGDLAASGGYYISCNADRIFAQPNTITGSIGVFGLIPNAQVLLNDKLGVTTDEVRLNPHAVMNAGVKPLDDFESRMIQKSIDSVYHTFLSRVANGRKSTLDVIETKAEGRVWSGTAAIKIGLVDEIGGLDDAVAYAAKKANLKSYRTVSYPKEKSLIDKLLEGMKGDSQVKYVEKEYGIDLKAIKSLHDIMRGGKIQARMPYVMEVE